MANNTKNPSDEGYDAGKSGVPADSNPHRDDSVSGRMFDILTDVGTANMGDRVQTQDKNADDWDKGHEAGSEDKDK